MKNVFVRRAILGIALLVGVSSGTTVLGHGTPEWKFDGAERIVAFADVHGAYDELLDLLQATGVIDEDLAWCGGTTHLISTGDLVDRGPHSRAVLDLLMRLEKEAEQAGGRFLIVLGNHEVMNMTGDLRYVSAEEYAAFADEETDKERKAAFKEFRKHVRGKISREKFDEEFPAGYFALRRAFSPSGQYGSWLIDKPAAIVVNRVAFVHGGLPEMLADQGPIAINRAARKALHDYHAVRAQAVDLELFSEHVQLKVEKALLEKKVEAGTLDGRAAEVARELLELHGSLLFVPSGPFWYRGTAKAVESTEEPLVKRALMRMGARSAVLGHTASKGEVRFRFDGKVTLLDAGMLASHYHGRPAALVIDAQGERVVYADEVEQVRAVGSHGGTLDSDAQFEAFLTEAEIVEIEDLGVGITKPRRVTLEKDGQRYRAVFKDINEEKTGATRMARGQPQMNFSDKYAYELAAYKLDRMLGLNMVPPTVLRKIKSDKGSLQLWVEDAMSEKERRDQGAEAPDYGRFIADRNAMSAFDVLILNSDRNMTNMLYTPDWQLHMIDHSRAFGMQVDRPVHLRGKEIPIDEALREKLAALTLEELVVEMKGLLSKGQVKSMLKRRDELLGLGKQKKKKRKKAG